MVRLLVDETCMPDNVAGSVPLEPILFADFISFAVLVALPCFSPRLYWKAKPLLLVKASL